MRDQPSLTVVIPSHNGGELTLACIESLLPQLERGDRCIVVDNGSWDGTVEHVRRLFGRDVHVIYSRHALGFAKACNRGAEQAATDFVVFINQDLLMSQGCIKALKSVASVKHRTILGAKLFEPVGTVLQHLGGIISSNGLTHHIGRGMSDTLGPKTELIRCDYVTGALFMMQRALFLELGGFDVRFRPAYFEETDLCVRAAALGAASYVVPWASARHFEAQVHGVENPSYFLHYHRNRLRFVAKHFTNSALKRSFLPTERAFLRSALPGSLKRSIRVAYLDALTELPLWLIQRRRYPPTFVPREVDS